MGNITVRGSLSTDSKLCMCPKRKQCGLDVEGWQLEEKKPLFSEVQRGQTANAALWKRIYCYFLL